MVLTGPAIADVAGFHGLVRTTHADGSHVDVTADQGHHPDRQHGMDHVCDLHVATHIAKAGNQLVQHQARGHHDDAGNGDAPPEQSLFARVEAVRRHLMIATAEQAAAFAQPDKIGAVGNVVLHKSDNDDQQRDGKQGAHEVVHVLERVGQPAKQRAAHDRQQKELAKRHHDARNSQGNECTGVRPVRGALKRCETLDLAARFRVLMPQRTLGEIENRQGKQHNAQQGRAIRNDPLIAHLAPTLASVGETRAWVLHHRLNQVAGLGRLAQGQAAVAGNALPHLAPHRRVVARLHLTALAVGLLSVLGVGAGVGLHLKDVLALNPCHCRRSGRCGSHVRGRRRLSVHGAQRRCHSQQQGTHDVFHNGPRFIGCGCIRSGRIAGAPSDAAPSPPCRLLSSPAG